MLYWRHLERDATRIKEFTNWKDFAFIEALSKTLKAEMDKFGGIGICAPQVGINYRVIMVRTPHGVMTMYNPKLLDYPPNIIVPVTTIEEGCLSIPDFWAKTLRKTKVKVRYQNSGGDPDTIQFMNNSAFAVQHELDHLDGKIFPEQLGILVNPGQTQLDWQKYREMN